MEASNSDSANSRRGCRRHTPQQTCALETYFKLNPYPDEEEQSELGRQIGLEQRQVMFWFQNRRSQRKVKIEKADNNSLRAENDRIRTENTSMGAALKNATCPCCGGTEPTPEERELNLENLRLENAQLKEECERLSSILAAGHSKTRAILWPGNFSMETSVLDPLSNNNVLLDQSAALGFSSGSLTSNNNVLPNQRRGIEDMEKALMSENATSALRELVTLLCTDDPLWIKTTANQKSILNREVYDSLFPRAYHFFNGRVESSKETRRLCMTARQLAEIFLDSDKWVDFFPTIVLKSRTTQALKTGSVAQQNGALQLMYEQIHFLSPYVPPQEFTLLRKCEQIEYGVWVVVDVSFDYTKDNSITPLIWKRPSGCIIRDLARGFSEVTWVQHVEVDDQTQTRHQPFAAPVYSSFAVGAERWVETLEMMSERYAYWLDERALSHETAGVFDSPDARSGIMNLTRGMVKSLCEALNAPVNYNLDIPELSDMKNSEFKFSVRKNTEPGQRGDFIVSATTSLWLPLPPRSALNFFLDENKRNQWDVLCNGNPVSKIAHISSGNRPWNSISVIQACIPGENNTVILQETCTDPMGWLVVYAPLDTPDINLALKVEGSSIVAVLPSGFVITRDDRPNPRAGASASRNAAISIGSQLVMAFQISADQLGINPVVTLNGIMSSTAEAIRFSFNC